MKHSRLFVVFIGALIIGVMTFGIVGAGAWYFDSATSANSIITSGTLDLQVAGEPFEASGLEPGADYSEMGIFCAKNTGTTSLKYRGLFETPENPTHDLLKFVTLKVEQQAGEDWSMISEVVGNPTVETDGLRYYFKYPDQDPAIINHYIVTEDLTPGQEVCYRLSIRLDASTPDTLQGISLEFLLHLYATQNTNPGWE